MPMHPIRALFRILAVSAGLGATLCAAETWAFEPGVDTFAEEALLDLRSLNEDQAGASGWLRVDAAGDFLRGDGQPIRFWALNSLVGHENRDRPLWPGSARGDLAYHARWLAKRGVNMVRIGASLNPDPKTQDLDEVRAGVCEWLWQAVGTYADQGIYTTLSPYWAHVVKSDDARWGTDWGGGHSGLLFFDERLQAAYKAWLRHLFTTPSPHLGGKTLAQHPGLGIFQIQNEDSLLFWTVNNIKGPAAERLGRRFARWAEAEYGSLDQAYAAWGEAYADQDRRSDGVVMLMNLWHLTREGRAQGPASRRVDDQLRFCTELMRDFNAEIGRYIREDLGCPVLVNAGNWKSGDAVLLDDAERYSYTANEVIAVNRYFGGMHIGEHRGWAIVNGDFYTNASALAAAARDFPLNLKQVAGRPMLVTEGLWVLPDENAFQAPLMIAAYSSLHGIDGYYWNGTGDTVDWSQPKSANGYLPSQRKWTCMTPDQAGQWPAAAYLWRKGLVQRGEPVVQEHRSLEAIYTGKTPIIAEAATFDPNRDAGDLAPASAVKTGVSPWAFLTGPVTVTYDSDESQTRVVDLAPYRSPSGTGQRVRSVTGELILDTGRGLFTVDTPACQAVSGHFPEAATVSLGDLVLNAGGGELTMIAVALDDQPLAVSRRILVQVGTRCRPTGWHAEAGTHRPEKGAPVDGFFVRDYGRSPWQVRAAKGSVSVDNAAITKATVLDVNGMPMRTVTLGRDGDHRLLELPGDALYVVLTP